MSRRYISGNNLGTVATVFVAWLVCVVCTLGFWAAAIYYGIKLVKAAWG